jgi:hypothetical protein
VSQRPGPLPYSSGVEPVVVLDPPGGRGERDHRAGDGAGDQRVAQPALRRLLLVGLLVDPLAQRQQRLLQLGDPLVGHSRESSSF